MTTERLEVLTILRRTEQYLRKAGIESPRLDAEVLLAHVLGVERIRLYTGYDRPLTPSELDAYRGLVRRRADREPVAYLTGTKEFYSIEFRVTPAVLVPRPDTEHLVDCAVEIAREYEAPSLLDVGTGSGCIAIAWAREIEAGTFVATDLSAPALEVARENADRAGVADRGEFLEGDMLEPARGRRFDILASNPPYVAVGEATDPECLREPEMAVFAGDDATAPYRRLLEGAGGVLEPGGHVLLELPGAREKEISALLPSNLTLIRIVSDYAGHPRVLVARHEVE